MNNKRVNMAIYKSSYAFSPIFKSSYAPDKLSKFGSPRLHIPSRGFDKELFTDEKDNYFGLLDTDTLYIFEDKHE